MQIRKQFNPVKCIHFQVNRAYTYRSDNSDKMYFLDYPVVIFTFAKNKHNTLD